MARMETTRYAPSFQPSSSPQMMPSSAAPPTAIATWRPGGRSSRCGCASIAGGNLLLRRRARNPEVAHRARRVGRRRLEALRLDGLADLHHRVADPLRVELLRRHADLLVVEHIEVGLLRGLDAPRPLRADGIQRE